MTGEVHTAAMLNETRDNLNALKGERALVATSETETNTAYDDMATVGPAVTFTTGTVVTVMIRALIGNNTAGQSSAMAVAVSGATTRAAADTEALSVQNAVTWRMGTWFELTGLTAGSNTFTAKYRVTGGTGTFADRELKVRGI